MIRQLILYGIIITYNENDCVVGFCMVTADGGGEYTTTADEISSEVDEDRTVIYEAYSTGAEYYYYYYTTIEVPVQ